jgi:hypothetical protein
MKSVLLVLLLIGAPLAQSAESPAATFYIQLIRGSDLDAPPEPQAKLIGAKLGRRLHDVFKWKNYWEIKRETVTLKTGAKVRKRMSPQREVEIAWPDSQNMMISLYTDGKLTRKRQQSIDTAFYIAGGDRDASDCWFIIVRRDNPDGADAGQGLSTTKP